MTVLDRPSGMALSREGLGGPVSRDGLPPPSESGFPFTFGSNTRILALYDRPIVAGCPASGSGEKTETVGSVLLGRDTSEGQRYRGMSWFETYRASRWFPMLAMSGLFCLLAKS